ncbi:uncharacterized protein LOC118756969 [Rhagoletis pomonella]|uniref:uncharacterized protein LOC118756969 n=1 Tax=Rhagoletis pomonella TaxID=28610 RepID=UPI001782C5D4|nr:uncharacterized protein LOC118756969 [Rhagoletis pomonella]
MTVERIKTQHALIVEDYLDRNYTIMYTDASLSEDKTGCGIFILNTNAGYSFHTPFKSSSAFGELLAIEEAIDIATHNEYFSLVIFTDSLISCQTLKNRKSNNSIAVRIHNKISQNLFRSVQIRWIPSRKNIPGNDKADELAKKSIELNSSKTVKLKIDEACKLTKNRI